MKKFLLWTLSPFPYLVFAVPALAEVVNPCPAGQFNVLCTLTPSGNLLSTLLNFFFAIAVIIAVIYMIYGGIKYIMSRGEKEQVEESRNHIVAAVVGLIITFLAFFIINIVLGLFLGNTTDITKINLPSLK